MQIERATNDTCAIATGAVVAIDVIRAFTSAAFALAAGARDIVPVGTVEEALALRERFPGSLAMGEVGGYPIEGFDFGNSPSALLGRDLSGRRMIQRTSAGTQGLVRSLKAETLLASSLVCAPQQRATSSGKPAARSRWSPPASSLAAMATRISPAPITWRRCFAASASTQLRWSSGCGPRAPGSSSPIAMTRPSRRPTWIAAPM